jgi:nucleotide-binding universal stress UspA family protein
MRASARARAENSIETLVALGFAGWHDTFRIWQYRTRSDPMSVFPTKILLATDGSKEAELALTTAVVLANSTDSELHVVTVAPGYPSHDPSYPAYRVDAPEVAEDLRRRAQEILEDQVQKIEQAGGEVAGRHLRVAEQNRAYEIVRTAEELRAGLIVLGSRGWGGIPRALMGGVSELVVRHAHCPVMVVRPEKAPTDQGRC